MNLYVYVCHVCVLGVCVASIPSVPCLPVFDVCSLCAGFLHPELGVLCGESLQGAWLRHVGERQQIQQRQHRAAFQVSRKLCNTQELCKHERNNEWYVYLKADTKWNCSMLISSLHKEPLCWFHPFSLRISHSGAYLQHSLHLSHILRIAVASCIGVVYHPPV